MTFLALPWLVLQLTHSPFQLGLVAAIDMLPFLLFGLIVGVYADRWDRRVILLIADLVRFAVVASVPLAAALHRLTLAQIYLVAFIAGTGRVWFEVSHYSIIPDLVTRGLVVEANSSLEVTEGVSVLIGPSLGGWLIKVFGAANALLADALSFLAAALSWLTIGPRPAAERPSERGLLRQLVAGLRFLLGQRVILENVLGAVVLNIVFTAVMAVFVFYAQHELHLDAAQTGLLLGLAGIGPVILATLAPAIRRRLRTGQVLVGLMLVTGPLIALLDIAPLLPPLAGFTAAAFALAMTFGTAVLGRIVFRSYVQAAVPAQLLGRVNATSRAISWGSIPIGAFAGGTLTQLLGVRWTFGLAAGLPMLAFIAFAVASETKRI